MSLERSLSHLCLFEDGNKPVLIAYSSQTDFLSYVVTTPSYRIGLSSSEILAAEHYRGRDALYCAVFLRGRGVATVAAPKQRH